MNWHGQDPNLAYGVRTLKREIIMFVIIPFLLVQFPLSCIIFCDVSLSLKQKRQELDKKIEKEEIHKKKIKKGGRQNIEDTFNIKN
jgi:hypothetical protein